MAMTPTGESIPSEFVLDGVLRGDLEHTVGLLLESALEEKDIEGGAHDSFVNAARFLVYTFCLDVSTCVYTEAL